jgi:hypothetical protein
MKTILTVFLSLYLTASAVQVAQAQTPSAMETVILARKVAEFGYDHKNSVCLLAAAQMMSSVNTTKLVATNVEKGEKNPNPKTEISLQPDKLLADAQSMASQDQLKEITAMANKIQVQRSRGAFGGPKVTQGQSVEMKATVAYTIDFNGGEKAELVVVGDSGGDLDLEVFDEAGKLVASDVAGTEKCLVSWVPAQNGSFTIKIKNIGSEENRYTLITN